MSFKKTIFYVLLLTIVSIATFILTSLLFDQNGSMVDGEDLWGWPFVYYNYSGGKMTIEPETRIYFNQTYLIIDWLVAILISIGLIFLIKKLLRLLKD